MSEENGRASAARLVEWSRGGQIMVLLELGRRTGVLEAMGGASWHADELAAAAGVERRYLEEWLAALASFGVATLSVEQDGRERWALDAELAPHLAPHATGTLLPLATTVVGVAHQMLRLVTPFRDGGGLTYAEQDPALNASFDYDARVNYHGRLVERILPVVPGLVERLHAGTVLADVGCGAAHELEVIARAFPGSRCVGFDPAASAIEAGRRRLASRGIANVTLHACAIEDLPATERFAFVSAFEVIHNLADPAAALAQVRPLVEPGGTFLMYETNSFARRADNVGLPWAGQIYTASLLSCLTVSLAEDGAGYGAMWGVETAERLLAEAGYIEVGHREALHDPVHVAIWGRVPFGSRRDGGVAHAPS